MSNSKIEFSNELVSTMAQKFKALSNPHRLRIFLTLARDMEAGCVHESDAKQFENCQRKFAEKLELAPSTVSHHFKELRNCSLVHMERQGKKVLFWVDAESVTKIRSLLGG